MHNKRAELSSLFSSSSSSSCAQAPAAQKKKKWSKGKTKEKLNNAVFFDQKTYDRLRSEIIKSKLITTSIIADRLRVNGTLARAAIQELLAEGAIVKLSHHHAQQIYTRAVGH